MKQFITAWFVVVCVLAGHAQNVLSPTTASVVAYWKAGDAQSYTLHRTKTGQRNASTSVRLDLKVTAATETSYTLECVYRDMRILAGMPDDPKAARATEKVLKAVEGMRVVVTTSETGILGDVQNLPEIQRHCERILKSISDLAGNSKEREEMMAAFSKVITADALAVTASEDLSYLLFPFGVEYTLGKLESGPAELPNPLGGEPIPAVIDMKMTVLDAQAERATIEVEQRIDPSGLASLVSSMMERLGKTMSAEERSEFENVLRGMKITDTLAFEIDLKGAWPTKAQCKRKVLLEDRSQTDDRLYERL